MKPGTVLILLAGRFRGKRVILLNNLDQGVLLVTGPFKVNGVPLRRVNHRYVIATSTRVDVKNIDKKVLEKVSAEEYFARDKAKDKKSEEAFFKQGEKPQVWWKRFPGPPIKANVPQKKELAPSRADDQKSIDKAILASIKKEPFLESYLAASFSLRKGDRPHQMVF